MSQRRNSPASGDERSDLTDMKALAARARAQTGSHPALQPNPAELSGVRPRRDSVVGARLTPPPRAVSGGQLPSWFWGVLGCLSVLLVGFGALLVLGRSGALAPYLGDVAPAVAAPQAAEAPPPAAAAPAHEAKIAEPTAAPAGAGEAPPAAEATAGEKAAHEREREHEHLAKRVPKAEGEPAEPVAAAQPQAPDQPAAPPAQAAADPAPAPPSAAAKPAAPAPAPDQPTDQGQAADDDPNDTPKAPPAKKAARAGAAKPAAAPAPDDGDDDQSAPGQDAVEAALDALATRVRGCFVKYQIKGTARVRLIATPAGTAESVNVTGEFEDTPTGMCVEAVISGAKLPTFKGPPLKLSQSYQLR